jgi:hypothetical protein
MAILARLLMEACCWPLALVGPAACLITPLLARELLAGRARGPSGDQAGGRLLLCCAGAEALFFLWFRRVLREAQASHLPPKSTKDRRAAIWAGVRECNEGTTDPLQYLRNYFSPHALEEISREHMQSFYAEAMFNCPIGDLTIDELVEMEGFLTILETDLRARFPSAAAGGLSPSLMRLHYDPVLALAKPLVYYAASHLVDLCSDGFLALLGFTRRRSGALTYWLLRPPKQSSILAGGGSGSGKNPIVFVHGVGLGLVTYTQFIVRLVMATPADQPIILLELPHASMKLNVEIIPSMKVVVDCTADILTAHHFPQAHFVVHSLGSFVFGAVQCYAPTIVSSVVLIDPVCFKLWEPHVMHNFCYRNPTTPMQVAMKHLVTRELTISHFFHRHFYWTECVLFRKDVPKVTHVIVSELDSIIDGPDVCAYLQATPGTGAEAGVKAGTETGAGTGGEISVEVIKGGRHGQWTLDWRSLAVVLQGVLDTVQRA